MIIGSEVEAAEKDPRDKLCCGQLFVCNSLQSDTIYKDKRSLILGSMCTFIEKIEKVAKLSARVN